MSETNIVFVVGGSRSGTTLVSKILGRNSCLFGLQETHYFGDIWNPFQEDFPLVKDAATKVLVKMFARQRADIWGATPISEDFDAANALLEGLSDFRPSNLFLSFVDNLAKREGKKIPVEQTPRNIFYLPILYNLYPDAKFIEVVRDPRAVLYSQRTRWRMRFLGAKNVPWSEVLRVYSNYHAITMSNLWRAAVSVGNGYLDSDRVIRVKYEDLVLDPASCIEKMCDFIGIEYQASMHSVPRLASSTQRNSGGANGITADSMSLWMENLPVGDRLICEYVTEVDAKKMGYLPAAGKHALDFFSVGFHLLRYPFHLLSVPLTNPKRAFIMFTALFSRRTQ